MACGQETNKPPGLPLCWPLYLPGFCALSCSMSQICFNKSMTDSITPQPFSHILSSKSISLFFMFLLIFVIRKSSCWASASWSFSLMLPLLLFQVCKPWWNRKGKQATWVWVGQYGYNKADRENILSGGLPQIKCNNTWNIYYPVNDRTFQ